MKDKARLGINLKIASATSVVLFTLLTVFVGTYTWFQSARFKDSNNNDIAVTQRGKFQSISFYSCTNVTNNENESLTSFSFDMDYTGCISYDWDTFSYSTDGITDLSLQQYDPFSNKHRPCLAIVELNREYDTDEDYIKIDLSTESAGFLGAVDTENKTKVYKLGEDSELLVKSEDGVDYYPLSSVVDFKYKAFSADEYDTWTNGKDTYDVTIGQLTDGDNFVSVVNATQYSHFENDINVYSSSRGQNVKYIAIVIDYYFDAIESIYSTFLGDDVLESNSYQYILHFICDWSWAIL